MKWMLIMRALSATSRLSIKRDACNRRAKYLNMVLGVMQHECRLLPNFTRVQLIGVHLAHVALPSKKCQL